MKVNCQNKNNLSHKGFYDNRALKRVLTFAAENGTLFAATTTLALSGIRPLAILATPNTNKKNKQVACAKSITSTLTGYIIALACSYPTARAIRKIDKNPEKYLSSETINILKDKEKLLKDSKAYSMATQIFKLGLGFLIAAPKSILTALGTPYVFNMFNQKENIEKLNPNPNEIPTFKGKDKLPKNIGKIINNKNFLNFVSKNKDSNFPLHMVAATDTLSTVTFVNQTMISKKLENKDKKPLIYNSIISTALSIFSTYTISSLTNNQTEKFINKVKKANKGDPNLRKYEDGIRVSKPIIIAGLTYYILIPIISTFLADRIELSKQKN